MKYFLLFSLLTLLLIPQGTQADGMPGDTRDRKLNPYPTEKIEEPEILSPAPTQTTSPSNSLNIYSWIPKQKAKKFLGVITPGVTDQWDIMRLLAGPNTIGVTYPEEKEMWGYLWLWSYDLKNPKENSVILMDKAGKRVQKGKNPVELYIVFNENDIVERMDMVLIKKKNNEY